MSGDNIYGERLREQRLELGLTQAVLIEKLGIGKSTIINWEQGSTYPTLLHLVELKKLGFNIDYLFSGEGALVTAATPPEPYAYIPVYSTEVCAGTGVDAFDSEPLYYHAFREAWLRERGYYASKLAVTKIMGESMVPDLLHGDYVLINMANNQPKTGCIFVVRIGQELLAKFIEVRLDRSIVLKCRNPFYENIVISPSDAESHGFHIVGEIVEGAREYLN
ncbi:helix-turn-helix domain-containing protein [Ignatzschineria rhizosphaerae]|uniref:Helix-turn-helix domain-containing protein n=1 Tax=Ignatzschineria rhizosphaerae TaxID=2923279 RepID=A0ABY3X2K1_9GAMM|nr:S24 family peptidase [Ignatzschineria rhizosphaerae]UNM95687.1 helix-turn-helix domain-containing protein [Ignatzschineria rhizosphaerae]